MAGLVSHSATVQPAELAIRNLGTNGRPESGAALSARSAATGTTPNARAKAAAQNFEAVFLDTMFSQMFTGIDGDGPFGGSGATGVWRSMLTDQYARSIAKAGGVGIAAHVYQSLLAQQEVKA